MRTSPLHDLFSAEGATFTERYGVQVPAVVSDSAKEYGYVRNTVGCTDFSYMQKYSIPEENAIDFLDGLFAGNIAKVRFGRVLHTFLADDAGNIIADCYIANNDEEFVLLCESVVDDATLKAIFEKHGAKEAGLKDLTDTHCVIGLDGYKAWTVAKELFGIDVLGLPYLSIEMYPFDNTEVRFFRAGKTSEFGYLLMVPVESATTMFTTIFASVKKAEGGLCGCTIHNDLRLEGRFFNIFVEGTVVKDPLSLGLQWMIDFSKEVFIGSEAIFNRRSAGLQKKIIGFRTDVPLSQVAIGTGIFSGDEKVAEIVASCFSPTLGACVGLGLFPCSIAFAGLSFTLGAADGPTVQTISMPPIMPKSLTVKLDDM